MNSVSSAVDFDNASLCHGYGGNRDIARMAMSEVWRMDSSLINRSRWLASMSDQWPRQCGDINRSDIYHPQAANGLMLGYAGIGYGLLRQIAPDVVPSVLRIEVHKKALDYPVFPISG